MTEFSMISYQRGVCGYPEDDWQIIRYIENGKQFLEALKEGYLKDASNRNQYPIVSHPISLYFVDSELSETEDELGFIYDDEEEDNKIHDYRTSTNENPELKETIKKQYINEYRLFEIWKKKILTLIPIIRKKAKQIEHKNYELEKLFELAEKYNFNLTAR